MKIGLIRPFYQYFKNSNGRPFAFGISYIANYVVHKGHQAEILDLNSEYLKKDEIIKRIRDMKCDILGISAYSDEFNYVKNLISLIKSNLDIPIVLGGVLATHQYELVLNHTQADICAIGQGEGIALDILNNLKDLKKVKGIAYKDSTGKIVKNAAAALIPLDDIPMPAYEFMNMDDYIWTESPSSMDSKHKYKKGYRVMQVLTGQGCPMGCNFCSKIMGRGVLLRSIDKVIEEIKFLMERYRINGILFCDELFLINRERAYELANKLKPLNIIWMGQARVDRVDYDLVKYMKKCGCISLGFGIESGSPKILKLMNKGQTVEQIEKAVSICKRVDMDMKVQMIMGYPGEDRQTIEETVDLFKRVGHPGRRFGFITPLPGSPLYDDLVKNGTIKNELEYLMRLSKREAGFARGMPLVNLTRFSDEELYKLKHETEKRIEDNYRRYLLTNPVEIFRYLREKLVYKGYLFKPGLTVKKISQKIKANRDLQEKIAREDKAWFRAKSSEYQL